MVTVINWFLCAVGWLLIGIMAALGMLALTYAGFNAVMWVRERWTR